MIHTFFKILLWYKRAIYTAAFSAA